MRTEEEYHDYVSKWIQQNMPVSFHSYSLDDIPLEEFGSRTRKERDQLLEEFYKGAFITELDSIWENDGSVYTIESSNELVQDRSGPYATTGTSVNEYIVSPSKTAHENACLIGNVEAWAGDTFKSSYMVSREVSDVELVDPSVGHSNEKWKITVKTTVWYN